MARNEDLIRNVGSLRLYNPDSAEGVAVVTDKTGTYTCRVQTVRVSRFYWEKARGV